MRLPAAGRVSVSRTVFNRQPGQKPLSISSVHEGAARFADIRGEQAVPSRLKRLLLAGPREDGAQLAQLLIHFMRRAHGLHDFVPNRGGELPAQTMDMRFDRANESSIRLRDVLIGKVRFFARQERRERLEHLGFAILGKFGPHLLQRALEDHARPTRIERFSRPDSSSRADDAVPRPPVRPSR